MAGDLSGALIRAARLEAGLSMAGLAAVCGVHFTTVYRWEHDRGGPSRRNRRLLAGCLDVPDGAPAASAAAGGQIRAARTAGGLTVRQLAAACRVHRSTVYRWECDRTEPSPEHRQRLAACLGLQAEGA